MGASSNGVSTLGRVDCIRSRAAAWETGKLYSVDVTVLSVRESGISAQGGRDGTATWEMRGRAAGRVLRAGEADCALDALASREPGEASGMSGLAMNWLGTGAASALPAILKEW